MSTAALKGMLQEIDECEVIEALAPEPTPKAARAAAPKLMGGNSSNYVLLSMEHSDRAEQSADRADAALDGCLRTVAYTQTVAKSTGLLKPQLDSRIAENEEIFADHRRQVLNEVNTLKIVLKNTTAIVAIALAVAIPTTAMLTAAMITNNQAQSQQNAQIQQLR